MNHLKKEKWRYKFDDLSDHDLIDECKIGLSGNQGGLRDLFLSLNHVQSEKSVEGKTGLEADICKVESTFYFGCNCSKFF